MLSLEERTDKASLVKGRWLPEGRTEGLSIPQLRFAQQPPLHKGAFLGAEFFNIILNYRGFARLMLKLPGAWCIINQMKREFFRKDVSR